MSTDPARASLYRLMAWFSPAFPVGAYSYSHGLEFAVEEGLVHDPCSLQDWVRSVVTAGAGRVDAGLICAAFAAAAAHELEAVEHVLAWGQALRPSAELGLESSGQGRAFLDTVCATWPHPDLERWQALAREQERSVVYPVAVALTGAAHGIELPTLLQAYLQSVAANLVSAGVRLVPLGQTDGQRTMAALEATTLAAARAALDRPWEDIGGSALVVDWASMRHETQYTRLFRS